MKKIFFSAAALSALVAHGASAETYVGATAGLTKLKTKAHVSDDTLPVKYNFETKRSGNGVNGDIFAGYRHTIKDDMFVGVEGSIGLDTALTKKTVTTPATTTFNQLNSGLSATASPFLPTSLILPPETKPTPITVKVRKKHQASVSVVAGKRFNKTTVYGRLGLGASKYRVQVIEAVARKKFKKTALEITPAVGVEHQITQNVKARAELAVTKSRFKQKKGQRLAGIDHANLKNTFSTSAKAGFVFTL